MTCVSSIRYYCNTCKTDIVERQQDYLPFGWFSGHFNLAIFHGCWERVKPKAVRTEQTIRLHPDLGHYCCFSCFKKGLRNHIDSILQQISEEVTDEISLEKKKNSGKSEQLRNNVSEGS
jgi:hypothetical protein